MQLWDLHCFAVKHLDLLSALRVRVRTHLEYCLAGQRFEKWQVRFDCRDGLERQRYQYCLLLIRCAAPYFLLLHILDFVSTYCHRSVLAYRLKNLLSPSGYGLILNQSAAAQPTFRNDLDPRNNPLWICHDQDSGIDPHNPSVGPCLVLS